MTLTPVQIAALETAGREVAEGWLQWPDLDADEDYDFSGVGDWEHVREAAIAAGVDWDPDWSQPDDSVHREVWQAVRRGYRERLAEAEAEMEDY
ncbi:MAG: hypothetical protein Q8S00_32300 [Deltaproteobacteria bacterium]|nr:hypothetical protein [Deltaproteobacteria bacterium]